MAMPDGAKKKEMMAQLTATKALMKHTKEHVIHAIKAGKMFGQPWFHIMFGNPDIEVVHQ